MNLRRLYFISAMVMTCTLVLTLQGLLRWTLFGGYEQVENQQFQRDIHRLQTYFENSLLGLENTAKSWAYWDEAYTFAKNENTDFVEDELSDDSLISGNLNLIIYCNQAGRVLAAKAVDLDSQASMALPAGLLTALVDKRDELTIKDEKTTRRGMMWLDGQLWLLAEAAVLKHDGMGPVEGTLVVGQKMTVSKLQQLKTSLGFDFEILPVTVEESGPLTAGEEVRILGKDKTTIAGTLGLTDLMGENSLELKLKEPRETYAVGRRNFNIYSWLLVGMGIMTVVGAGIVVQRLVITPFSSMVTQVTDITRTQDFSRRVEATYLTELSKLSGAINHMLDVNQNLTQLTINDSHLLKVQLMKMETGNRELSQTKMAILNILEDQKELEDALRREKLMIQEKIEIRTKELKEEHAKLKASIDGLPVGYLLLNREGTVILANRAIQEMTKMREKEEMMTMIKQITVGREEIMIDKEVGLPTQMEHFREVQFEDKILDISVVPVVVESESNSRVGWVILINDITEAKNIERARDEFFSIASHELRTPLTAIRGNTSLIRDYFPEAMKDEGLHQTVDDIYTAAVRLIQIVNDFLDASRLEMNRIQYKMERFDILPIINKVTEAVKKTREDDRVKFVVDTNQYPEYIVMADKARVEQVLYNLIGNASKFTKEGEVKVAVNENEGKLRIRIIDSGVGIAWEKYQLLFKKFQQAGENVYTRSASQGSGMGLYISRLLARAMGGDIWLERSELDKGSVFVFDLIVT